MWDPIMDNILIETLIEQERKGYKHGNFWDPPVCQAVVEAIFKGTQKTITKTNIESRMRTMKTDYRNFYDLKEKSGHRWDPVKQTVDVPKATWDEIYADPRVKEEGVYLVVSLKKRQGFVFIQTRRRTREERVRPLCYFIMN